MDSRFRENDVNLHVPQNPLQLEKMKIENGDNFIEIEVSLEEDDSLPSKGDAYVMISVNSNGFSGRNDLWVMAEEFQGFCTALASVGCINVVPCTK